MADDPLLLKPAGWSFGTAIPQRFSTKYDRYQQLGGLVDIIEDARAYAGQQPIQDVARFMFLSLAFDQIHKEGIEGDCAELGVYQGSTATILARNARRLNRRLYLLDTYEGFDTKDFLGADAGREAQFGDTSLEAVEARVGEANTVYIKGYFPETAAQLPPDASYCLVHIDTDLYAPIMSGLEYFYPRMAPGGYLIVHDYGSLAWAGADKAVDAFFADKPESVIQIPDSCGSAVVRRLRRPGIDTNWMARHQCLEPDVWHKTANGGVAFVLTEGWSTSETWGIWGVGSSHRIRLLTGATPGQHIAVDLDVHAFVWDEAAGRPVDIFVNDQFCTTVRFTKSQRLRSLTLEPLLAANEDGVLILEFRPQGVVVPKDLCLTQETRALGVALHGIRMRVSR